MMLDDVSTLFAQLPRSASRDQYIAEVLEQNCLGKPTRKARELAYRHVAALYGLDTRFALFRALRGLWAGDEAARPVLALTAALARDPLLRGSRSCIFHKPLGQEVSREEMEEVLEAGNPGRFSPVSLRSFAQNVNGTWTQAGYLRGHRRKIRVKPVVTPANVAFCLFLGYLEGATGQQMFSSNWIKLLGIDALEADALARGAAHRGLLVFMSAGGVKEVRFPDYLTADEERIRQEAAHVV